MAKFADLHCHPHMRSFNWLRNTRYENKNRLKKKHFHPWFVVASKIKAKEEGRRANAYSQSDLIKLKNGNVRLAFVSLYPMEKGWVTGNNDLSKEDLNTLLKSKINNRFFLFLTKTLNSTIRRLAFKVGADKGKRLALRDMLQALYLKLPLKRINYLQSNEYDYFDELIREKDFLLARNDKNTVGDIYFPFLKQLMVNKRKLINNNPKEFQASGIYKIAKNGNDVENIFSKENEKIIFVFTIEGVNVFNTDNSEAEILKKIKLIKNWSSHPVFFISFSHHFSNHLCGHAHSIPDIGKLILDQSGMMNEDFTNKGKKIIRYILSLDDNNVHNPTELGRRILIDIKHMSALSRKTFYQDIIHKCNDNEDFIPIIASHCAYSGIETLDKLIERAPAETDKHAEITDSDLFNSWNINLSNEDIVEIFNSKGIIGVNFDQRILGNPKKEKEKVYPKNYDVSLFWDNVKAMMDVIIDHKGILSDNKKNVITLFALGTDFDGYIDPLDKYPTTLEFDIFRIDLINKIEHDSKKEKYLYGLDVKTFVDRICYQNGHDFVVNNFK